MKESILKQFNLYIFLCVIVSSSLFVACSNDKDKEEPPTNTDIYAGKDFVGSWQGSDGTVELFIQLAADGTYADWIVINGKNEYKADGKYTVTDNKIKLPGDCNFATYWGSGNSEPIMMSFSGKNQMTWTTSTMELFKQKFVFNRK